MRLPSAAILMSIALSLAPLVVHGQAQSRTSAQVQTSKLCAAPAPRPTAKPAGMTAPGPRATVKPAAMTAPAAAAPASADEEAMKLFAPVGLIAKNWVARPELYHSMVGLEIMDMRSGRVLFSHNGNKRFVTASIAKVLTTACAYETLGGDYVYHTALVGYGDIRNARLNGNLTIVPSQDPSFSRADLHALLSSLPGRGIKFVSGRVFAQPVAGGGDHFQTEWLIQDYGQDWMPVSSDFVVDRNVTGGGRDPGAGYPLNVVSAASEPNSLTRSLLQGPWGSAWVVFNGANHTVNYYRPDVPVTGGICVGNPTEYNAAMARQMLNSQGVKVDGHDMSSETQATQLGEHVSKPLSTLIRFTLKESDNLYAQQLLRTLGTLTPITPNLAKASLEDRGLARIHNWLQGAGVPGGDVVLWDGCGLSRKNAITPHAFNLVMRHMIGCGSYTDLLIHDGEGETSTFRFKTGAMDSVRSISGIVKTSTGQPIAVTAIINDHQPSVRELRTSLGTLISQLEGLSTLKLTPLAQPKPASKAKNVLHPVINHGNSSVRANPHQGRRSGRRSRHA